MRTTACLIIAWLLVHQPASAWGSPTLAYATYMDGAPACIAVDPTGCIFLAGSAIGGLPVTPGAYQTVPGGNNDACIIKLNSTGTAVLFCTYLGGPGSDKAWNIALDP